MTSAGWQRRGLLLPAPVALPWSASHAALPVVAPSGDGIEGAWDLYLACRDKRNRAHIVRARLRAATDGLSIDALQERPALGPGELGSFDDSGVTVSCVVDHGRARYLYYSGWSLGVTVPFYFYVGVAVSDDGGGSFRRVSRGPVFERNDVDPFLTASPSILIEDGRWRAWYVSASGWQHHASNVPRHRYHLRYAESDDGVHWRRDGRVCVDFRNDEEYAFGRPCVVKDGDRYRMWFCARGEQYRLAYAESSDGLEWERDDGAATLHGAPRAWEAEMQAYPFVFHDGHQWQMLYNGNGYGATGVGWATLAPEDA